MHPILWYQVNIDALVASDHYDRRLEAVIDWTFLYKETEVFTGQEGQEFRQTIVPSDAQEATSNPHYSKRISRICARTVEPVWGTLINFMSLRRVNAHGMLLHTL